LLHALTKPLPEVAIGQVAKQHVPGGHTALVTYCGKFRWLQMFCPSPNDKMSKLKHLKYRITPYSELT
jgi:hypothetical protein